MIDTILKIFAGHELLLGLFTVMMAVMILVIIALSVKLFNNFRKIYQEEKEFLKRTEEVEEMKERGERHEWVWVDYEGETKRV